MATAQRPSGWRGADGRHCSRLLDDSPAHECSTATLGAGIAERIVWVEGDLGSWAPDTSLCDLASSLYVHVAASVEEMVSLFATGVAPGGTLFLVGHQPIDPVAGAGTPASGEVQVAVEAALVVLDRQRWEPPIAEDHPKPRLARASMR